MGRGQCSAMYVWPAHRFNPKAIKAFPVASTIDGGTAINGDQSIINTDRGGRWSITFSGIDLRSPAMIRLWNAWVSHLAGGAQQILVPTLTLRQAHIPKQFDKHLTSQIVDDDAVFPTSVAFVAPMVKARVAAFAATGATTVQVEVTQGGDLVGGEVFGVGGRAYPVKRITAKVGSLFTCLLGLPLRASIATNDAADFNWPVVQCRAVPGQDLVPDLAFGRNASMSISFAEDFSEVTA